MFSTGGPMGKPPSAKDIDLSTPFDASIDYLLKIYKNVSDEGEKVWINSLLEELLDKKQNWREENAYRSQRPLE